MASESDPQSLTAFVTKMINNADEKTLAFMMTMTAAMQACSPSSPLLLSSPGSSSSSLSSSVATSALVSDPSYICQTQSTQCSLTTTTFFHRSKKRQRTGTKQSFFQVSPLLWLSVHVFDVMTNVVFPFLDLASHMRLARVCVDLLKASGLPRPFVKSRVSIAVWSKLVRLPFSITPDQLFKFCVYASPSWLDLSDCDNINDDSIKHLRGLPLRGLDVSDCEDISDAALVHLQGLPLRELNLCGCKTITDLVSLQNLPLQIVNLSFTEISDAALVHLQGLPLRELCLCCCKAITSDLVSLPNLPLCRIYLE